jgi:hypothetical protein
MPTETGHNKLLSNYRQLIDLVSADSNYKPTNPLIKKPALEANYTAARTAVDDVATADAPSKMAINDRQVTFNKLPSLVRRSRSMLKASGASKEILADADTLVRKLTGGRKTPKVKPDPKAPNGGGPKQSSASQMSFDNRSGNFLSYVEILRNVSEYAPTEPELSIAGLQAVSAELLTKNNAVSTNFVGLSQARATRDGLLYANEGNVVDRAGLVKSYVAAAIGPDSQLYRQIKGLEFRRPRAA